MNRAGHCWRCEAPCTSQCSRCKVAFYCSKPCQKQDKWRHEAGCDAAMVKKTCNGCGKKQDGMLKCSNCLKIWYCGVECQKKNWENHKVECRETVLKTLEVAVRIKMCLESFEKTPGAHATYFWGNTPAVDLINLSMNEGEQCSSPLALLLCGVGDPRNVLLSIASLPDVYKQQVTFVLNDICPCTLARTVLLLYMLYKGGNDVASTIIRVWYSLYLTEKDHNLLTSALQELITTTDLHTLTEGLMEVTADQLNRLQSVWVTWSSLARSEGSWVAGLRQEALSRDLGRESGLEHYLHAIPKEHRKSAKAFFDTGIFTQSRDARQLNRQNETLTGRRVLGQPEFKFSYSTPTDILPFTGWDYKAIKKVCRVDSLPDMYSTYISQVLNKSIESMRRGQVKLHVILCNCVEIEPFLPAGLRYDRIITSNLSDYIHLTTLLTKLKSFLNSENAHSVLITETINWPQKFLNEIFEFIKVRARPELPFNLTERALKDTGNPELVHLSGMTSFVEYQNLIPYFLLNLRAALLASQTEEELASYAKKNKLPSIKSIVSSLGLELRDFVRNENSVFPFKWAVNCRRVAMLRGFEYALEWKLSTSAGNSSET